MESDTSLQRILLACQDAQSPAIIDIDFLALQESRLMDALERFGYHVSVIDLDPIRTELQLLQAMYRASDYPDEYFFTWDSLEDNLLDFHWQPAGGYVFIFRHPETLNWRTLAPFIEIVHLANEVWSSFDIPFKLIMPRGSIAQSVTRHLTTFRYG